MSIFKLDAKAATYFELLAQIESLTAEAEAIKDVLKGVMVDRATEELNGTGLRATWHNTSTTRFDSRKFKAEHADLYSAYTIKANGTRFTLHQLKA